MPKSWKWKVILLLVLIVTSVYLLVPTIFGFREKSELLNSEGKELPWYFSVFHQKGINLGLDLRGGIYLEFNVELKEAVENKIDLMIDDMQRQFKDEEINVTIRQDINNNTILISSAGGGELARAVDQISGRYQDVLINGGLKGQSVVFEMTDGYKKKLHDQISKQSLEKIRNRIDRYGVAEPTIRRLGSNRIAVELPGIKNPDRAIAIIKQAGKLEFKIVDKTMETAKLKDMIKTAQTKINLAKDDYTIEAIVAINQYLHKNKKISDERVIAFEMLRDPVTNKITGGTPYFLHRKTDLTGRYVKKCDG